MDKESQQIFEKEFQEERKKEEINNNNGLFPGNEVQTENKPEEIDNTKNIKEDMTEKNIKELKKEKEQVIGNNELPPENDMHTRKEPKELNNNKYNNDDNLTLKKEKKDELNKNLLQNNFDSNKNNQRNKEAEREKRKESEVEDLKRVEINKDDIKDKDKRKQRPKGYVRLFRKIIKKKNEILMKIFQGRFKKWKNITLKGIHFKKTIIVRISVSRDKDEKEKFKTQENFANYRRSKKNTEDNLNKNNYIKIDNDDLRKYKYFRSNEDNSKKDKYNQKIDNNLERDKHIKKSEFKPYKNILRNSGDNNKTYFENMSKYNISSNNNTEWKNNSIFMTPKENKGNKIGIYDKYKTNNRKDTYILIENREDKSLQTKKIDNYENKRLYYPKNNLNQDKNNIQNNRTIPNNEQKNHNNVSNHEYIYKRNDEKKILEKKIDNKYKRMNNNEKNNTQTIFYTRRKENDNQKDISTPNKNFKKIEINVNQSNQRESLKLNSINQYNTKKYQPPQKTISDKKPKATISYLNNTYQRSNNDKLYHTANKEDYKKKLEYQNFSYNRDNKTFNRQSITDKMALKKGITSVIQHYLGMKKQFDNYDYNTIKSFN